MIAADTGTPEQARGYQIAGMFITGVGGAFGAARGMGWGLAAFAAPVSGASIVQAVFGGTVSPLLYLGALSYCLGGVGVRLAARRGFVLTERVMAISAEARAAQRVAEQRWRSGREDSRRLHDTVLVTMAVLAHRGEGLDPEQIRLACRRDLEILTSGAVHPTTHSVAAPALAPGGPAATGFGGILARASQLPLEIHVHGLDILRDEAFDPDVAQALGAALLECLVNVSRHSGVLVADIAVTSAGGAAIVVVIDEGIGFDLAQVESDRLGLLSSVRDRIADVGGSATVWTTPDLGTSVVIRAPFAAGAAPGSA